MDTAAATVHAHAPSLRRRVRATLSWLHLWLGLSVGTLFTLVALAGSVLVFHTELLRWQHPQLARHEAVADGQVFAGLVEQWAPRGLRSLDVPRAELPVWQGYFKDGSRAYFAPEDGALLLRRSEHDDVLLWLHEWHTELLGGETGKEVLGVAGWIALALVLIGLYLWWPKRGRMLAQLKVHAGPPVRRWLTWHRSTGVVLLPLLLLAMFTGVGMVYSKGFNATLTALFGGDKNTPPKSIGRADTVDWPHALQLVQGALPGAQLHRVSVPKPDDGDIVFRLQAAGEWHPVGRSTVTLGADGRERLQVYDATGNRLGTRISDAIFPLHVGVVGGGVMKWLTALTGLLPAFLLVTGFLFWRRRRGHH